MDTAPDISMSCPSAITATNSHDAGVDDPDRLVPVAAGELFEWAWLAAELADWLNHAADTTTLDFARFFHRVRRPEATAMFLAQISERIAGLLDGDRGQS